MSNYHEAAKSWAKRMPEHVRAEVSSRNVDMYRIGHSLDFAGAAEVQLSEAVAAARENGRSWEDIALVLDMPQWKARLRFGVDGEDYNMDGPAKGMIEEAKNRLWISSPSHVAAGMVDGA